MIHSPSHRPRAGQWLSRPRAGLIALMLALAAALPLGLLAAGSAHAQDPELISVVPAESGELTVIGRASASVENDTGILHLTVSAVRATARGAIIDVNATMNDVVAAVMGEGVLADDLRTANISLRPEYDFTNEGRILIGIRFSNSLIATVNDVNAVGDVLDAALAAGGDLLQINGVNFTVSDRATVEDQVRLAAVQNAIDKATAIAGVLGITLGHPITVTEIGFASPVRFEEAAPVAGDSFAPTPVFSGESEITVSVQIVFQTWPLA